MHLDFTVGNFPPSIMSPENDPTTGTIETDIPSSGQERADALLDDHVNQTGTVGEVRSEVRVVLTEVQGDQEAENRVEEYKTTLDAVATGHDHVKLEQMSGGKQGENHVGTHNSKANTSLLHSETLIGRSDIVAEVLDHEDEEETGHAGQIAGREGLVLASGDTVAGTKMYEGEVESQQARKHRGSVTVARDGQPAKDYGDGQKAVAPKLDVFEGYLRDGVDRAKAQAELMQGQSRQEIIATLSESGMYDQEEIDEVTALAA